jgi:hypothetical protein
MRLKVCQKDCVDEITHYIGFHLGSSMQFTKVDYETLLPHISVWCLMCFEEVSLSFEQVPQWWARSFFLLIPDKTKGRQVQDWIQSTSMKSRITCHTLHGEILTIHKTIVYSPW